MLRWILFDLNSFFASCEQQQDPSLRGKPVAVVPTLADSTSVIAASYEAKQKGIKTGTKVGDAKKMCPGLILKTGNHRLYTEFHYKIVKAVEDVLPIKHILSIDEVACELIGKEREVETAKKLAQQMKDYVRQQVGSEIKSSVGIGPNILIAKMASDMQKPDGLVWVRIPEIAEKLGPLPIDAIPGVGRQMKYRLNQLGYFKVADFLKVSEHQLRKHWGNIAGLRIAKELQGVCLSYRERTQQKSISHQHVLPPQLRTTSQAFQVLLKLLIKALARMRTEKQKATQVSIYVKFMGQERFEKSISFTESDDNAFYIQQVKNLWPASYDYRFHQGQPFKVAVVLSGLSDERAQQLSFFDDPKKTQINQVLDLINDKFGNNTLYVASIHDVMDSGKTRISFNHIPKLTDEFEN
jgi:DNA polymerase-4